MDRYTMNQSRVDTLRGEQQLVLPTYETPLPGTALKLDDDVLWLGFAPVRVVWGFDEPDRFLGYSPEELGGLGDYVVPLEGQYITDRAPLDPQETPMPVYPQQAQQPQHTKHEPKKALQRVLKLLKPHDAKRVRALVREKFPHLLEE